jgi:putative tricarboxylic transport membrane protein
MGILLTPLFVACIKLRKKYLLPLIIVLCVMGVYSIEASTFDLWVMLASGLAGYGLRRGGYPLPPLVIGLVLGQICEGNFRRSLTLSGGSYDVFVNRPICATIIALNAAVILWMLLPSAAKRKIARCFGRATAAESGR